MTDLRVVRADITTRADDAIVNAANSSLMGGGGVDGAIHRAGGPEILAECRAIVAREGPLPPGRAVITTAGRLPAHVVIHTVGPVWTGDDPEGADEVLASCYRESLALAVSHSLHTIAFPCISTGVYGFPSARAAGVAVATVGAASGDGVAPIERVTFVCFSAADVAHYRDLGVPSG